MERHACAFFTSFLLLAASTSALAQDNVSSKDSVAIKGSAAIKNSASALEEELRKTVTANIESTQAENLPAMMQTIHSRSPLFDATKQQVSQIFGQGLNLKYELLSLKYLATEGDFSFARVRQRTTQDPPANFRNNELDLVMAFRKEDGVWKFWTQAVLEIKYLP